MTSFCVDADKHRVVALMTLLQRCSKLERMGWYHTVVVVGCCDEGSRVGCSRLQVVQR